MQLGWHSRGYLPHFEAGPTPQFVTFRLADSLPRIVVDRWRSELQRLSKEAAELELYRRAERYLDQGHGACFLRDPRVACLVEDALFYFDAVRYRLHCWVVMPNHAHVLFTPEEGWSLSRIVGTWKSMTSRQAGGVLGRSGRFWQREYFDRFMRSTEHCARTVRYIEENPVKAGLCATAAAWRFSSASRREAAEAGALG